MSSYSAERQLGYEEGIEAGREIANKMYEDGLRTMREFEGDENATVFYHVKQLFEYLKVDTAFKDEKHFNKLVNKYKTYLIEEKGALNVSDGR